jgi:hypothetical protein
MMGSLGHGKAFGQLLRVRVRGVLAWFVRRTYYLLQMPGWGRRLRIMIDWTFALLFRPDIVKLSLDSEAALALREAAAAGVVAEPLDQGAARNSADTSSSQHAAGGNVMPRVSPAADWLNPT